jgi:hypothetical protein
VLLAGLALNGCRTAAETEFVQGMRYRERKQLTTTKEAVLLAGLALTGYRSAADGILQEMRCMNKR